MAIAVGAVTWRRDHAPRNVLGIESLFGEHVTFLPKGAKNVTIGEESNPLSKYIITDCSDKLQLGAYSLSQDAEFFEMNSIIHIGMVVKDRKLISFTETVGEKIITLSGDAYLRSELPALRKRLKFALTHLREHDLIYKLTNAVKTLEDPKAIDELRRQHWPAWKLIEKARE